MMHDKLINRRKVRILNFTYDFNLKVMINNLDYTQLVIVSLSDLRSANAGMENLMKRVAIMARNS